MDPNGRILKELVGFVDEQRRANARYDGFVEEQRRANARYDGFVEEQRRANARYDGFVEEQRELNRQQMKFNRAFAKEMRIFNQRWQDLKVDSEKRFRAFYHLIVNLQRRG